MNSLNIKPEKEAELFEKTTILASKGTRKQNIIFGELHFLPMDQSIEHTILQSLENVDYIISEILLDKTIDANTDIDHLRIDPAYDIKCLDFYRTNVYTYLDSGEDSREAPDYRPVLDANQCVASDKNKCNYNLSKAFLIEWFKEFKIPIVGIEFYSEDGFDSKVMELYRNYNTVSFIGRMHAYELFDIIENAFILAPIYNSQDLFKRYSYLSREKIQK